MNVNMKRIQDRIIADFSRFDDWFDIYEYLINKGKTLRTEDNAIKTEENSIGGCQSSIWIKAWERDNKIHYDADSDSLIIKGILSLILDVINDQEPLEIAKADFYFLNKIGLLTNLSPSRVNGVNSIVKQIKDEAKYYSNNHNK